MDATSVLYAIDAIVVVLFCVSYYRNCYRQGFRIDLWHWTLFLQHILPTFLLFPFAFSDVNEVVIGGLLKGAQREGNLAFAISLTGFLAVLFGAFLFRLRLGVGLRGTTRRVLAWIPRQSYLLASSRTTLAVHVAVVLLLDVICLRMYFSAQGFGFNFRSYYLTEPSIRALANFTLAYATIICSHCFARYLEKREKSVLLWVFLIAGGLIFFGARSALFFSLLSPALVYLVLMRTRVGILRIAAFALAGLLAAFLLDVLRTGAVASTILLIGFYILYGNTFSDLRDFGVVLSVWDGGLLWGKTYLSALMSFVPRFLSPFRDQWSLGVVTATLAGFDPSEHPGLRPGRFGEAYLNFGLVGVIVMGLVYGIVLREINNRTRALADLDSGKPKAIEAFSWVTLLFVLDNLSVSSGFATNYVLAVIFLISFVLRWLTAQLSRNLLYSRRLSTEGPA